MSLGEWFQGTCCPHDPTFYPCLKSDVMLTNPKCLSFATIRNRWIIRLKLHGSVSWVTGFHDPTFSPHLISDVVLTNPNCLSFASIWNRTVWNSMGLSLGSKGYMTQLSPSTSSRMLCWEIAGAAVLVRFPNCHECQLGFQCPKKWEIWKQWPILDKNCIAAATY